MTHLNGQPIPDHPFGHRMPVSAHSQTVTVGERRSHDRIQTRFHATVYCHNRFQTVIVRNISPGGIMMSDAFGLAVGDYVVLSTLTGQPYTGRIAWSVAPYSGLAFTAPIALNDPLFKHRLPEMAEHDT